MDTLSTEYLVGILVALIGCSAFFSSSETGMLSLNRYRLRHLVKKKQRSAIRASQLLARPDRLISVILIGNNFVNFLAAAVAGIIVTRVLGEWATVTVLPIGLTIIILIFAEVTPKSVAAAYPEKIAFPASFLLKPMLWVFYPLVVMINGISGAIARLLGLDTTQARATDHLRPEELRTVVDEAGSLIPKQHQGMLLNVLDLEKATVEDIMIPRSEVIGIDLESDIQEILELICSTEYTRLPVYEGDINNIRGVLHLRHVAKFIRDPENPISHQAIIEHMAKPYFIPESTPLSTQLLNFQKERRRMAVVVDEYGDIQGIATVVDLLEEIVGDFSSDGTEDDVEEIEECGDEIYSIDASVSIRDINKNLGWSLPTDGPKTLNGIIVEHLESIPEAPVSFQIDNYRMEITELSETRIERALVYELST